MRSIAQNQPFLDGNKRTAWAAARVFLEINGIDVQADIPDVERLMLAIAEQAATLDGIADFLADHAAFGDFVP